MGTRWVVLRIICFTVIVAVSIQPLYAQLDTLGFPLAIGTKWFYRYTSKASPSPYVRVKTIIDTTQNGTRIVRVTKLHKDSTLATERWIVKNGSFYIDSPPDLSNPGVPIYNSSLIRDTTSGSYGSSVSYGLNRVTLFGSNLKSQTFSYRYVTFFSEFNRVYRVALGVGIFYHYYHTWGGESSSWTESGTLIGLLKDGRLYGDSLLTSVENRNGFGPLTFRLEQNYPNPFNPSTKIKFQIPRDSHATLKIYNSLSQVVATPMDAILTAGEHQVIFTAAGLSSGVYFCRLESGPIILTRKMLLME